MLAEAPSSGPHAERVKVMAMDYAWRMCHTSHHQPHPECPNPSFGLATKAKGVARVRAKGKPGSVGECEGVNPHTPKATPALGDGVPVDSRNFRDRFEGPNRNGLRRSL
jgi:hypothetical protein